jgi:hypothetical protein
MVSLIVLLIVVGCAAFQFLKGTLVRAFATFIITICASVVAFGYFELLADVFIGQELIMPWAQTLSFLLLFLFTFAVLQTLAQFLTRQNVDLGLWPERIGRVVCGIFSGLVLSGFLLTAFAMAPLPGNYPYQRFDQRSPDAGRPNKTPLNIDAFASGLFSIVSKGSLSGKSSFAALHPAFIDQLFLNRLGIDKGITTITKSQAVEVPKNIAFWPAPQNLKNAADPNRTVETAKQDGKLTLVRIGISSNAVGEAGTFTLSQLRLICKQESDDQNPFAGKGQNIYPVGYMTAPDTLQIKRLNDVVKVTLSDFEQNSGVRWIDFAFYVPAESKPVLLEFKQNSIVELPEPKENEPVPQIIPFVPAPPQKKETPAAPEPEKSSRPSKPGRPTTRRDAFE